jgi:hypothetical protein
MGFAPLSIDEYLEIEAIKRLRIMYSHYFDMHRLDEMAELFTEDAVCEFGEQWGGDWVGRKMIREKYGTVAPAGAPPFIFMHANTNPWIELTGPDSAKGRWYLLDLGLQPSNTNALTLVGVYDDVYKKVDGKWYIHRTRIDFCWPRREYHGPRE